jgi:hypothetical protein
MGYKLQMGSNRMLTKAELKRRGWTEAQIRDRLGEPDQTIGKATSGCYSAASTAPWIATGRIAVVLPGGDDRRDH